MEYMWVNAPSTHQMNHDFHGRNVLVDMKSARRVKRNGFDGTFVTCYFLDKEEACELNLLELSNGMKRANNR